jgi:hypothetical protein
VCDCRRGLDRRFIDHLYTQLETTITALSLITTLYKSSHHPPSLFQSAVLTSRCLVTASNDGGSWASGVQESAHAELISTANSTIAPSLLSLPCRAQLNCQPSTNLIAPILFFITTSHGPHRKHRSSVVACVFVSAGTCVPSLCSETVFRLFSFCIATVVLIVYFEVFVWQRLYTPQYGLFNDGVSSVYSRIVEWFLMMNWKGFGSRQSCPNRVAVPEISRNDWGMPRKPQ